MSSALSGLAGVAEKSAGEAVAFGLGFALGAALEPAGTALRQEAWKIDPLRAPDAQTLAEGVATGQVDEAKAREWATEHGIGHEAFDALVGIANVGPALGLAYNAWRRGELTPDEFNTALRRQGIEERWWPALRALKSERIDVGALATAIHRGIVRGAGLLIAEPPTGAGRVPHVAQSDLDPIAEAAAHGLDPERLRILVGNTGLPLALGEMLQLLNRDKVDEDDVRRAIANSNIRNEYMDVALELRHQLPTARDFLENALRGYRTLPEAIRGAALHGLSAEHATLIYQNQGRPMTPRLITQALARGGKFEPEAGEIADPYRAAIVEGNLKPAYYDLAYANRYTLPSPFVLRALAASGELSEEETHQLLLETGWPPWLAAKVSREWSGGGAGKGDPHVAKAQTHLWNALHRSYVAEESDAAAVTPGLTAAGVADPAAVLALWDAERNLIRAQLSPAQIKKAYGSLPDEWPREKAIQALLNRGYARSEAGTLLDE